MNKKVKSSKDQQKIAELTDDLQRVQAEFINFKKRSDEEKAMLSQFAKADTVKKLLPIIDDLERALAHAPKDLKGNKWAEGVTKVYDRLLAQLEKMQIKKIEALNKPFDPLYHAAVSMEGEGHEQVVSEVMQNGYLCGDQVIRHAAVKVVSK